ncbi:MAG: SUF system Fe-S cluster assembly regulator [Alphaproteobacteria bacterium]|nr:MAG: SUF system Fe-S cluster assembly regulator [Alphaproteobacteria bacterium]
MLKIGRLTDYAVVLLCQMSGKGVWRSAGDLARESRLPEATVAKVLKQLARGGLLVTQRGASGGYDLARPSAMISVAQVIEIMEGQTALTPCAIDGTTKCRISGHCSIRGHWREVNRAIRGALEKVSLEDMARDGIHIGDPMQNDRISTNVA